MFDKYEATPYGHFAGKFTEDGVEIKQPPRITPGHKYECSVCQLQIYVAQFSHVSNNVFSISGRMW
jgi:hypothetical protein